MMGRIAFGGRMMHLFCPFILLIYPAAAGDPAYHVFYEEGRTLTPLFMLSTQIKLPPFQIYFSIGQSF